MRVFAGLLHDCYLVAEAESEPGRRLGRLGLWLSGGVGGWAPLFAPEELFPIIMRDNFDHKDLRVTLEIPSAKTVLEGIPIVVVIPKEGLVAVQYLFPEVEDITLLSNPDAVIIVEKLEMEDKKLVRKVLDKRWVKVEQQSDLGRIFTPPPISSASSLGGS